MPTLSPVTFWKSAAEAFASDTLELTILPTEKCNLRCTYCYEKFELGKMTPEVVDSVQQLLTRRAPELRRLKIGWFGGEPLLAIDVIEAIGAHARQLAAEHPAFEYSGSATSNGVLMSLEVAQRLVQAGVNHVHVSLDGPAAAHDLTRTGGNGRGTFADLQRNLLVLRDSDVDLVADLRVHVTPLNADLLDAFTEQLIDTFLPDDRFNVYFFPIVDLGGPQQGHFGVLRKDEAARIVHDLTERVQLALAGLPPRRSARRRAAEIKTSCESPYVCYAAKPNAWVIRSNGRLAKCTVGFEDPRNDVGRLTREGRFDLHANRLQPWMRGWASGDQLSLHCPYEGLREDVRIGLVESRA